MSLLEDIRITEAYERMLKKLDIESITEALAVPKKSSVDDIANYLMKERGMNKKKAKEKAKEIYSQIHEQQQIDEASIDKVKDMLSKISMEISKLKFKNKKKKMDVMYSLAEVQDSLREDIVEEKEINEATKKKYGGKNLKYRFHYGMDLSELINLVKHKVFENVTKRGLAPDPDNNTQYNNIFTSVINEVQDQLRTREKVALKEIKKVLPEIITDALTLEKP